MKHIFLGGNTPKGFVSFYDSVLSNGNRLFILKGGSGVGKHTFMTKCANIYLQKGYEIEYLHCSNDVNSLDGIIITQLKIAMIDGTSPHMVDPQLPGCFDEIVDLGVFINYTEMEKCKEQVSALMVKKKNDYKSVYKLLNCVNVLYEDNSAMLETCMDADEINKLLKTLPEAIINQKNDTKGASRQLFASSYTSNGYYDFIDTLIEDKKTIGIKSHSILNKKIMQRLCDYALSCGHDVIICRSPIDAEKIDHIILDDLAIVSIDCYNKFDCVDELYNIEHAFYSDKLSDISERLDWNNQKIGELIEKATELMVQCNKHHKSIEDFYIPNMNFDGVNVLFDAIILKINQYIQ